MATIAINGLGRIGRAAFKILLETPELELRAVNDLNAADDLAYLLNYDTVYGRYHKRISPGYVVDEVCRLGNPADEILKVASQKNIDLIVTGAKGLGAIARFLLGSVSTRIVQHSSCSVRVVR